MPQFLYHVSIPGCRALPPQAGKEEFGGLLKGKSARPTPAGLSPSGEEGLLLVQDGVPAERAKYAPEAQEWAEWGTITHAGVERSVMVGMWLDWQPGPEDLRRDDALPGVPVELADGKKWELPVLFRRTGAPATPMATVVRANGDVELVPMRRYAPVEARFRQLWKDLAVLRMEEAAPEGWAKPSAAVMARHVCDAIALNYRVTYAEIGLLQVVDGRMVLPLAMAIVDVSLFQRLMEDLKKKTPDMLEEATSCAPS